MRIIFGVFLAVLLNLSSSAWADSPTSTLSAEPESGLKPSDVVKIVIDALRINDPQAGDEGIATVWRFAAPSNKAFTGPLPRFTQMLKEGFADMLNHVDSEFGPIIIEDDLAMQPVWLITPSGDESGYVFHIRKQVDGEYAGLWMTEAVFPIAPRGSGTTI